MMRLATRLVLSCVSLGLLPACQPGADAPKPVAAPPAASAATAPAGAPNDAADSLMAEAFPGWTSKAPYPMAAPSREAADGKAVRVLVSPALVAALDADHRMLVVSGPEVGGDGRPQDFHPAQAHVGLYGFERRGDRWFKTFERPSLTWTGFNGNAGTLKVHAVAAGRTVLSIENGSCWQGTCGEWLQLYALGINEAKALSSLMAASTSTGATFGCAEWLKGQPLAASDEAMPITADNCFDVSSQWRFETRADAPGWPDLVVTFSGSEAVGAVKPNQFVPRAIDSRLVLRHDGSGYKVFSGRNPTHEF